MECLCTDLTIGYAFVYYNPSVHFEHNYELIDFVLLISTANN